MAFSNKDTFDIDSKSEVVADLIEVFDEVTNKFRKVKPEDNLGSPYYNTIGFDSYYYGIMFPKRWCQMHL